MVKTRSREDSVLFLAVPQNLPHMQNPQLLATSYQEHGAVRPDCSVRLFAVERSAEAQVVGSTDPNLPRLQKIPPGLLYLGTLTVPPGIGKRV
ncbi:uncharacterized protein N7529_003144 [Penicillium soppii]|jgi:hypothetical protein|uniref:uncharacterized protein n=1 Tax=Penicillium soppii TaxID=69789 RepID=UPI002548325A|nr:uncharacterized protein N7529_003144 [Penicillium soppii]KAJ5874714.1 hypothetical protein N7529_003144 [Penicillium soppii]